MKRKCKIIRSSADGKRHLCLDLDNMKELLTYISQDERHKKKFNYISTIIIDNLRIPDLYDKEEINDKCKDVTAMKLFKGQENDRIYCKEIKTEKGVFIVVAAELYLKKKSQKLTQELKNLIEKVASYDYELSE